MAGLNCGTPCRLTWPAIRDKATFFCACDDIITEEGMRAYANPIGSDKAVLAGESGAVTYGLVNRILQDKTLRNLFRINADSVVLLVNTEGDTEILDIKKPDVCASGFLFGNSNNSLSEKRLKQNIGSICVIS